MANLNKNQNNKKENGKEIENDIKSLHKKIKELEQLTEKYLNGWKRERADYQNREREMIEEKEKWMKFSNLQLIKELLYIFDSFNFSINQIPESLSDNDWVKGIVQISTQFERFLKGQGVEKIKTVGKNFDHRYHEAANNDHDKDSDDNSGKIIKEVQAGYTMYDRVIRPAKVIVK